MVLILYLVSVFIVGMLPFSLMVYVVVIVELVIVDDSMWIGKVISTSPRRGVEMVRGGGSLGRNTLGQGLL
jgi:hypothetical protein